MSPAAPSEGTTSSGGAGSAGQPSLPLNTVNGTVAEVLPSPTTPWAGCRRAPSAGTGSCSPPGGAPWAAGAAPGSHPQVFEERGGDEEHAACCLVLLPARCQNPSSPTGRACSASAAVPAGTGASPPACTAPCEAERGRMQAGCPHGCCLPHIRPPGGCGVPELVASRSPGCLVGTAGDRSGATLASPEGTGTGDGDGVGQSHGRMGTGCNRIRWRQGRMGME